MSLYNKLAGRVFASKPFIMYQSLIALTARSAEKRERASIILQAVILKAEPRTPIRLLKRLHERLVESDKPNIRYILDELRDSDYQGRTPYQIDFPWEMEYIVNLLERVGQLWNVEVVSSETIRDTKI